MRSRLLTPLITVSQVTPYYLREHSKRILRSALYNDSKFLADINVMDYSLVVGIDNEHHELVVGIVGKSIGIRIRSSS
jgi:1-phosphatidylinositol-3-phosphate 5-kinase